MNTLVSQVPMLKPRNRRDYVFVLEELELTFSKRQLEQITSQFNNGMGLEEISKVQKRDPREVFLALFHQADKNKLTRAFAYREIKK